MCRKGTVSGKCCHFMLWCAPFLSSPFTSPTPKSDIITAKMSVYNPQRTVISSAICVFTCAGRAPLVEKGTFSGRKVRQTPHTLCLNTGFYLAKSTLQPDLAR